MIQRLIVHIGSHKTGTKAIQQSLVANRNYLARRGIAYPDVGFDQNSHRWLAAALRGDPKRNLAVYAQQLASLEGTILLSSEDFSAAGPDAPRRLAAVLNQAAPSAEISIVYYLRNILDIVPSLWAELVKAGLRESLIEYYAIDLRKPVSRDLFNPATVFETWAKVFGRDRLAIYLYDKIEDASKHFSAVVLGIPDLSSPGRLVNQSPGLAEIEIARLLNYANLPGFRILQRSQGARALAAEVQSQLEPSYLDVDLGSSLFGQIEETLRPWTDRMMNYRTGDPIFKKRERRIEYVGPDFWATHPELAMDLKELKIKQRADNATVLAQLIDDVRDLCADKTLADSPRIPRDFDPVLYLILNPDILTAGVNPYWHFLEVGESEKRQWRLNIK